MSLELLSITVNSQRSHILDAFIYAHLGLCFIELYTLQQKREKITSPYKMNLMKQQKIYIEELYQQKIFIYYNEYFISII